MGKRGPAPGTGGRPRQANPKGKTADGYKQRTVDTSSGPKQVYAHRAAAGVVSKPGVVINHRDHQRANNSAANLEKTTKAGNTAESNRRRAGKKKPAAH